MAQQQGQGQGTDNSMAPVWIIILLFVTAYLVWTFAHHYIVAAVFFLNVVQAKAINFFVNSPNLASEIFYMQTANVKTVDWNNMVEHTRAVGVFLSYPVMAVLGGLAIWLYQSNIALKYRKAHDMKTLRAQEQHNWHAIMPVIKEDLVKADVNEGPWAMAQTPMEFARKHELLKKQDLLIDAPKAGEEMTASIRKGDAKRVFTLQLGPYFNGFDKCPPPAMALAGVFMARMNRDRDAARDILRTLDTTFVTGKPDYAVAKPIVQKYQNTEAVREILDKHAYLYTVMASLLEGARDDGVVPASEFLWLKPVHRRLWYMLNSVGRQTPFAEVGGPFAHWKAEKVMGRASLVPMVEEAIKALEIAVKEVKLSPKEMKELKP